MQNALDCPDLWGVTRWCSHDVDRALADFPELEYGLGLLTNDRRVKPAGTAFAEAVTELRRSWQPRRPVPPRWCWTPRRRATAAPRARPGGAYFEAWMQLAADGVRPACVLAERAHDADRLAARGIRGLLPAGGTATGARR